MLIPHLEQSRLQLQHRFRFGVQFLCRIGLFLCRFRVCILDRYISGQFGKFSIKTLRHFRQVRDLLLICGVLIFIKTFNGLCVIFCTEFRAIVPVNNAFPKSFLVFNITPFVLHLCVKLLFDYFGHFGACCVCLCPCNLRINVILRLFAEKGFRTCDIIQSKSHSLKFSLVIFKELFLRFQIATEIRPFVFKVVNLLHERSDSINGLFVKFLR